MAMVMPRAFSSGALSMLSKARKLAQPFKPNVLVIAAVSVVLPWSTWPMVPTLICGLSLTNCALPILYSLLTYLNLKMVFGKQTVRRHSLSVILGGEGRIRTTVGVAS